jgi:urea carboxylase-associated protein 2
MPVEASGAAAPPGPVDPARVLWTETVPGGCHWSGLVRRGTTLRFTDTAGGANASVIFFNQEEKLERYNMADTLKAQHTAYLTRGFVCYSDMGRVLCSITADTCGWHDTVCGVSTAATVAARYGIRRFQEHRNDMIRSGRDGLLVELGKYGLGARDLVATVNLFSKAVADDAGNLRFVAGNSSPGALVDLRFEMNCLVALSAAPHPLDPGPAYAPKPVKITAWRSDPPGADDICRNIRPENGRGFHNTEALYR